MKLQLWYFCLVMLVAFAASRNIDPSSKLIDSQNIGKFVMISDFHYDPKQAKAEFGQDSPLWLINTTVFSLADIVRSDPLSCDFILTGGDLVAHSLAYITDPSEATSFFVEVLDVLTNSFEKAFGSNNKFLSSPVVAIGNNDLYPKYAGPGQTPSWFVSFADHWPSINYQNNSRASFLQGGCFSIDIPITEGKPPLRVISLHTNYWSVYNTKTTNDEDPGGVFEFLRSELAAAKAEGVMVYIIGHIPPGIDQYDQSEMWQSRFVPMYTDIVTPYLGNTIMGQLYGHEHVSLVHMLGDQSASAEASRAGPVQYHSSISPYYSNFPSFRIYTYDRDSFQILDYEDWFMDFEAPNPHYQRLFSSALEEYNITGLGTQGYCEFINNMYENSSLLATYAYNSILPSPSRTPCTGTCYDSILCQMQFLNLDDFNSCMDPQKNLRLECLKPQNNGTNNNPGNEKPSHTTAIVVGSLFGLVTIIGIILTIVYFKVIRPRNERHRVLLNYDQEHSDENTF